MDGEHNLSLVIILYGIWSCVCYLLILFVLSRKHDVFHDYDAGIVYDTHVHASSKALDWTDFATEKPAAREVEGWLPAEYYFDVNLVFVSRVCMCVRNMHVW